MNNKPNIFVIMPFLKEFFDLFETIKKHFADSFCFTNASTEDNQQNILADIIQPIYSADLVLADLTGINPNVMYELGIAHALEKKTIIITQDDINTLPFDLKQYRTKSYSTHYSSIFDLLDYLEKNFNGAIDGNVVFSNPVMDFLERNGKALQKIETSIKQDDNKGFLDFLAEIDEDGRKMATNIQIIQSNMERMATDLKNSASEIERVKSKCGSGTPTFMRKETQKIAVCIDKFSKDLHTSNCENRELWINIENNLLQLLENKFSGTPENAKGLRLTLKELKNLQISLHASKESLSSAKGACQNLIGLERNLTHSIKDLDKELTDFLNLSQQMIDGVDKIISKGKFVVGTV